ncbi:MAG: thioredoxin [Armatimonadetes bacterium]|nr:thioredoxin [Armatimonadota bacterium]MDW8122669.1 thioredoxin [Armatimonadota bacterium]
MPVKTVTAETFDAEIVESEIPAVVDFWAEWCVPCRAIAPVVEALAEQYAGKIKVAKLNVDENPEIAIKYQVMSIPTLLFFKGGQEKDRIIGVAPRQVIEQKMEELLA